MNDTLENFAKAFASGCGGIRRTCDCGKEFYSSHYSDRGNFEEGELEGLEADPKAIALDYTVSTVVFGGAEYVVDCECWHEKAEKCIQWLDTHADSVARFFTLEKERKQKEADRSPTFEA